MLRVTDLDASIKYYTECLGLTLLRTRENPEYEYTLAFLGYGPEAENCVFELTYNWRAGGWVGGVVGGVEAAAGAAPGQPARPRRSTSSTPARPLIIRGKTQYDNFKGTGYAQVAISTKAREGCSGRAGGAGGARANAAPRPLRRHVPTGPHYLSPPRPAAALAAQTFPLPPPRGAWSQRPAPAARPRARTPPAPHPTTRHPPKHAGRVQNGGRHRGGWRHGHPPARPRARHRHQDRGHHRPRRLEGRVC